MRPAAKSCIAGAEPRYGMCWIRTPIAELSSTQPRCVEEPAPPEPNDISDSWLRAYADELGQRVGGEIGASDEHQRLLGDQRHRRKILDRIIERALIKGLAVGLGADGAQQHLRSIRRCLSDAKRAGHSAGSGDVFHDHLLTENLAQTSRNDATDHVGRSACRERHHHGHGLGRPVLRACSPGPRDEAGDDPGNPRSLHGCPGRHHSAAIVRAPASRCGLTTTLMASSTRSFAYRIAVGRSSSGNVWVWILVASKRF